MPIGPESAPLDELVIATQNPGKVAEIREMLAGVGVRVLGLDEAGGPFDEPLETGRTFEDNAALKAMAYARLTRRACLADDSGLEVDALGGRPGVDSAWYAYASEAEAKAQPREVRDPANNAKLLWELEGVPAELRTARFVCCMALAAPRGDPSADEAFLVREEFSPSHQGRRLPDTFGRILLLASSRGIFEGRIGIPPRVPSGKHGFGYDPLFLIGPGFERTSAELSPAEKNAVSHRAAALRAMVEAIRGLR